MHRAPKRVVGSGTLRIAHRASLLASVVFCNLLAHCSASQRLQVSAHCTSAFLAREICVFAASPRLCARGGGLKTCAALGTKCVPTQRRKVPRHSVLKYSSALETPRGRLEPMSSTIKRRSHKFSAQQGGNETFTSFHLAAMALVCSRCARPMPTGRANGRYLGYVAASASMPLAIASTT